MTSPSAEPESLRRLAESIAREAGELVRQGTVADLTKQEGRFAIGKVARIAPHAWVINQSLLHSGSCDPLLQRREHNEHRYIAEVVQKQATRTAWLPWQAEEPTGPEALAKLSLSNLQPALT